LPLLKALNGYGPKAKTFGDRWTRGGLSYQGVDYNIGPSPDGLALNLVNEQEYVITPMWNVIGIINGTIEDEVVILGNHRDAWIAGGAGDPNSGSAALNEVIRSFGVAVAQGWKPLRTIVFASWDGEEYGLLGSTEWVEDYVAWLNKTAVAYLNVDVGTTGPNFKASAAPLLHRSLIEATKLVPSPNQTVANQSVYDIWTKHISTMGSGSDFTAFQDFAGVPSVDMGFSAGPKDAVYHYHSNYDSFYWMDNFGDPGWHYHVTAARLWSVLAAKLIETPIIPLNATDYAKALIEYKDAVKDHLNKSTLAEEYAKPGNWTPLFGLELALGHLLNATEEFDATAAALAEEIAANPIPWWKWWEKIKLHFKITSVNNRYKYFERQFLFSKGLDGRPWFKHVVFAPGKWTGYSGATYPGLVEAIDEHDKGHLFKWANIILALAEKARHSLTR
jgi:N-acetylated-alpha-linked acidic dipeptidase